ncbi:CAAX amino protease [Bifidobacterium actinocoloniiforme DSM 22766]|uniref:CAAX amino protease n=1 Tax=Bifidobacterium actinocoloniiforme DSM 22766 TaxID=1437605 RepID=A0A086YYT9_9BIFI|nr:CPBP family intramembrane glutamic endopeptidase [Bifidobacterium actinocoloniiforme]AKV55955.1 hypothetical protein AB656_07190 [Bifidobacterium actinocoloniiforme DSM 22766]KFI39439.1 CAAX amino protease [Bifidobacterium actinocoloniiforme DSM 22766]
MTGRHAGCGKGHPRPGSRRILAKVPAVAASAPGRVDPQALSRSALAKVRDEVSSQAVFVFLYMVAMQLVGYALGIMLIAVRQLPRTGGIAFDRTVASLDGSSTAELYLFSTAIAFAFMVLYRREQVADPGPYGVFRRSSRSMTAPLMLTCLLLSLGAQSLSMFYDFGLSRTVGGLRETTLNGLGASALETVGSSPASPPMLLYSCLWAPVVEETVFRGAVLGSLKRYGRGFAVVTSSFLFALMHGSLSRSFFAFGLGLVLGFLACEHSLIWSIALHITSNLIAIFLPGLLRESLEARGLSGAGLEGGQAAFWAMIAALAALTLLVQRRSLVAFLRSERSAPNLYASWGSYWFLFVSGIQVALILWRLVH